MVLRPLLATVNAAGLVWILSTSCSRIALLRQSCGEVFGSVKQPGVAGFGAERPIWLTTRSSFGRQVLAPTKRASP